MKRNIKKQLVFKDMEEYEYKLNYDASSSFNINERRQKKEEPLYFGIYYEEIISYHVFRKDKYIFLTIQFLTKGNFRGYVLVVYKDHKKLEEELKNNGLI